MTQQRILSEVSLYTRIPISILKAKNRTGIVVASRALASKVMLKQGFTLTAIASFFGQSDHTSVMNYRDKDYPFDGAINDIIERLTP